MPRLTLFVRHVAVAVLAALLSVSAAMAKGESTKAPLAKIKIALKEQNASGRSGTATLERFISNDRTLVTIQMSRGSRFPRGVLSPAHIHKVTCAQYARLETENARRKSVLEPFFVGVGGRGTVEVLRPLAKLTTGRSSIDVHGATPPDKVLACGNVPKR